MHKFTRSPLFTKGPVREFHYPSDAAFACKNSELSEKGMQQSVKARYQRLYNHWQRAKNAGMTHKIWHSSTSKTRRRAHSNALGQIVEIDKEFNVDGENLFLPSDPTGSLGNTANCMCRVKYIAKTAPKRSNPSQTSVKKELSKLAVKHNIPLRALVALISAESDWQQFDINGQPNITASISSSAGGLGQLTRGTANLYNEDYYRALNDWVYNLGVSVKVFAAGYNHVWNRSISDLSIRAARAYGMYHDGFQPAHQPDMYSKKPRGLTGSSWEARYLSRY